MGRLILLLVVMAVSSHLERPTVGREDTRVGSMTSPEFSEQSWEHSSSNLPRLPLPHSPSGFNHQAHPPLHLLPPTQPPPGFFGISCLCSYRSLNLSTWVMCTHFSQHSGMPLLP